MFYKMTCTHNTKKYPTMDDYINVVNICNQQLANVIEYHYQFGKDGKLHIHALIEARANFYIKKIYNLLKPSGYHFLMEKFNKSTTTDVNGWLQYIRRDKDIIQNQMAEYYRKYIVSEHIEQIDALGHLKFDLNAP